MKVFANEIHVLGARFLSKTKTEVIANIEAPVEEWKETKPVPKDWPEKCIYRSFWEEGSDGVVLRVEMRDWSDVSLAGFLEGFWAKLKKGGSLE